MITRFKVDGFKNLIETDLMFGPFTCIAGVNAVGKSNLFDALKFLSLLASEEITSAASRVRSEGQKASDIRDLFHKIGDSHRPRISFEVDLIIPTSAIDELGATAAASITTVRYTLILKLKSDVDFTFIEVEKEELAPISLREARSNVLFKADTKWKKKVIEGRRSSNFISTEEKTEGRTVVRLHQDQEKGKPFDRDPSKMTRTALSTVSAEFPTAYVVREELRSWTLLQLEPSSLRKSDGFEQRRNARIQADGSLLPSTVHRLQNEFPDRDIMQELANRLSELIDDVGEITIDKDERRQLLTLNLKTAGGILYPARSLSDGTLRFLALTVMELDVYSGGVLCLEEPENGIHPKKIPAMLRLLQDIACDSKFESDLHQGNPLRQVIINTHSPLVVQQVPEDSLLMAESEEAWDEAAKKRFKRAVFKPLSNTWRTNYGTAKEEIISKGAMISYLGEVSASVFAEPPQVYMPMKGKVRRVADREDTRQLKLELR